MLEDKLEQDIKQALLARDSTTATTLRGLKATLLNIKVATGKRETGLNDDEVVEAFFKEAKKRQESADLYMQGGNEERASAELKEKSLIETYLPEKMNENELIVIIDQIISQTGVTSLSGMGQVIRQAKIKAGAGADGALIANLVKERLQ
jgi:uncharacterized protein YqeY